MKVNGLVVLTGIKLANGQVVSTQKAVDYGWVVPETGRQPAGWDLQREHVVLGRNLFTDSGRQQLAYCLGARSPLDNFVITKFGVGTGTSVPRVTDTSLESPLTFYDPNGGTAPTLSEKPVDTIDFPSAFVIRVAYSLAAGEANGHLLTELGLFSGNSTLIARKVNTGINKQADFSPQLSWLLRL